LSDSLELVESVPSEPKLWPRAGLVSADRSAIMGQDCESFLYQGTNKHFDAYFDLNLANMASRWAALTTSRHQELTQKCSSVLSVFVPSKATILPFSFPQPITRGGTVMSRQLKESLADDRGVLFPLQNLNPMDASSRGAWLRTDSHWSQSGCLFSVNEMLARLGLPPLEVKISSDYVKFSGDLSTKWIGRPLAETRLDLMCPDIHMVSPELEFDNGGTLSKHFGRYVRWVNKDARYQLNLTIVGDSFSGPGESSRELTWWFSRLFKSVTFLHMALIPIDVVEMTACDVFVFEITERFLTLVPTDNLTYRQVQEFIEKQ